MANGGVVDDRFSLLYLDRRTALRDSPRFRVRLLALVDKIIPFDKREGLPDMIRGQLGVRVPSNPYAGYNWQKFFENSEIRDILDFITIFSKFLSERFGEPKLIRYWSTNVEKIFREENMGYTVDDNCVVHYYVDEEFERVRFSTLRCLSDPKYSAVQDAFETSYRHLDADPPETKAAVRSMFESIEILYKQMADVRDQKGRLNADGVNRNLRPIVLAFYGEVEPSHRSAGHLLTGLLDWIDAAHVYRHGQATGNPAPPPLSLSVQLISMGASYLRWLTQIDRRG